MKMAIILQVLSTPFVFKVYSLVQDECELHGCNSTWINDTWCDKDCQFQSCNYDGDDCSFESECIDFNNDNSFCQSISSMFQYAYGVNTATISVETMCTTWNVMLSLGLSPLNKTCATLFDTLDTSNDTVLSIHEFVVWVTLSHMPNISMGKAKQIDCGCCETCNQDTNSTTHTTTIQTTATHLTTIEPAATTQIDIFTTSVIGESPGVFDASFQSSVYHSILLISCTCLFV
eukprot:943655_1